MGSKSLADVLPATNLASVFRARDLETGDAHWGVYEEEYTHWIEEQRSWRETCSFMDQSYHLANYYIEGPDALALNADLGVNGFEPVDPERLPLAKQHPVCNPDGYVIGDPVCFQLANDRVVVVGNKGLAQQWIHYHAETGDYDVDVTDVYSPYAENPPVDFRFEVQGPNADAVLEEVADDGLPDLGFFQMGEFSIDGVDLYLLAHGMASARGYELFGPYAHHDEIAETILSAGEAYGMHRLGSKSYRSATLTTGWLPSGLPAVYDHEALAGYREWLGADAVEARWSLGGSFESDDLTDYYLNPVELGYEHFIDFEHDFVGKEAIEARLADPERTKVTLVWDADDVVDVYASLFRAGETDKSLDLPTIAQQWAMGHYDRVERDGGVVGLSLIAGYDANEREMLSLGVVDVEYADPGTELTLVWGEADSPKATVERHVETAVRVTVAPTPYVREREEM